MKKILHIMRDDKFNDRAVVRFDAVYPGGNIYVALQHKKNNFRYIKSSQIMKANYSEAFEILGCNEIGSVIFHSLPNRCALLFPYIRENVRVVWIGWGYDYYPTLLRPKFPSAKDLLEPLTYEEFIAPYYKVKQVLVQLIKNMKKYTGVPRGVLTNREYSRVDIFVPVLRREWEWSRDLNQWFRAKYIEWNFHHDNNVDVREIDAGAENILIGNSATLTNNHLDAFEAIAGARVPGDFNKVICPLSYGDKRLAAAILNRGKYYFGKRFMPLTEFLENNKYWEYTNNCHTVVMNNIRQQGLGNINRAFSVGARVVLNARSVLAEEYSDRGLTFDILSQHTIGPLRPDVKNRNIQRQKEIKLSKSSPAVLEKFISHLNLI